MRKPVYPYRRNNQTTYEFISVGRKAIVKNVEFAPTAIEGVINLGFGDLLEDGTIDDETNSNNGDITRVMSTIINIIEDYTLACPHVKILFQGSTPERTRLYGRILKTYYKDFTCNFVITALRTDTWVEEFFNPDRPYLYDVYFIQRIS
jgi:hypothetical protein